jgi:hypothetical protein
VTELLIALVAGIAGGVGGALCAGVLLRGEGERWDTRVADIRSQVEDLEARWLSWQRRANKRTRDASGRAENDDQHELKPTSQAAMGHELLRRARARGIVR